MKLGIDDRSVYYAFLVGIALALLLWLIQIIANRKNDPNHFTGRQIMDVLFFFPVFGGFVWGITFFFLNGPLQVFWSGILGRDGCSDFMVGGI